MPPNYIYSTITADRRYSIIFRNMPTMDSGKVKAKQVGRFLLQRLKLEDGFQVGGRGELGEANRRMWPPRKCVQSFGPVLKTPKTEYTFSWWVFCTPTQNRLRTRLCRTGRSTWLYSILFFFTNEERHLLPLEIGNKGSQVCVKRGRGFSFVCVPTNVGCIVE